MGSDTVLEKSGDRSCVASNTKPVPRGLSGFLICSDSLMMSVSAHISTNPSFQQTSVGAAEFNVRTQMLAMLTSSDIVAVLMGILQIVASILVAIWTVRRTATSPQVPSASVPDRNGIGLVFSWLKGGWLFFAFFVFGFYQLWSHVNSDISLSKQYVNLLVYFSFYSATNLGLAIAFFAYDAQMYINRGVLRTLEGLISAQGKALELQQDALSIAKESVDLKTKRTGRRR